MQHLLGTCCSNVQDYAAKQIGKSACFFTYILLPPQHPRKQCAQVVQRQVAANPALARRLGWRRPATFSRLRLQHFLRRPLPGRQSLRGGDLMAGLQGSGLPAENKKSETTRQNIAIRTTLLNYMVCCLNLAFFRNDGETAAGPSL